MNSNLFGVSVVTTDGQVYSVGDITYSFSIQSISKVYSLALAMEELGADQVFTRIGSEPTGRAFNSVPAVVDMPTHTGNPFVNAGAIATISLVPAGSAAEKWNKILALNSGDGEFWGRGYELPKKRFTSAAPLDLTDMRGSVRRQE